MASANLQELVNPIVRITLPNLESFPTLMQKRLVPKS
jgi:hypothetical protein